MDDFKLNERLQLAFDYLYYTGRNVFLTGKAGTGKTTFLRRLRQTCPKRNVVCSPTGVAAINAGGVTLHSFFQLPFGPQTPDSPRESNNGLRKQKIQIIKSLELLIIDEISMVRADLLDSVDIVLRRYRGNSKPFGGVQLLLIGDMQQLSPVVRPEDEEILRPYYKSYYFFGSLAWQKTNYVCIELNQVFRQTDQSFISILNAIREGKADGNTICELNKRCIPDYEPPQGEDVVTLVTTNRQADQINQLHMLELTTEPQHFMADVKGDFPESSYPVDSDLVLKEGAVVMFMKNDTSPEKQYYNGKIGRVSGFDGEVVLVKCAGEQEIRVAPVVWENTKYIVDEATKEIKEDVAGTFKQIPLRTAWAVTIHKSQGLTFDKLMINASNSFAHGQVYVALSRCRTLEGLVLLKPLSLSDLIYDPQVESFAQVVEQSIPNNSVLVTDKRDYFFDSVEDLFNFHPIYNGIQQLQRLLDTHTGSFVGNKQNFVGLDSVVFAELMAVSDKFMKYIRYTYRESANVEQEEALILRIQNGCAYYLEKMQQKLEQPIKTFGFDCDDKAKKQKISDAVDQLTDDFDFRKRILSAMKDGFSLPSYMARKASLMVDSAQENAPRKRKADSLGASAQRAVSANPVLCTKLLEWRNNMAQRHGVEPKDIVSTQCIVDISNKLPSDIKALSGIKGMGSKAKKFGVEILKLIYAYMQANGMTLGLGTDDSLRQAEFESLSTQEKSFKLFNDGKSVAEISSERKLKAETIMGHLSAYVSTGEIDPLRLISREVYDIIKVAMLENPGASDGVIMTKTTKPVSYGAIHVVRAAIEAGIDDI
ncbi:MAG: AAA family ATPase [Bacteroidales bacterium]|nr:AAA family ATPase [Bacteroidales bacterium]